MKLEVEVILFGESDVTGSSSIYCCLLASPVVSLESSLDRLVTNFFASSFYGSVFSCARGIVASNRL